jgi:hypothetical protein
MGGKGLWEMPPARGKCSLHTVGGASVCRACPLGAAVRTSRAAQPPSRSTKPLPLPYTPRPTSISPPNNNTKVHQLPGERSYHIFYQLVRGADKRLRQKLRLPAKPEDFKYLAQSGCLVGGLVDFGGLF